MPDRSTCRHACHAQQLGSSLCRSPAAVAAPPLACLALPRRAPPQGCRSVGPRDRPP
uniref:Uncharacterized protein n=1 Tax=Arundo donax TaxID=35708 RepID=A0A0A9CIV2_ARUDO